jgi:hypothetical protein
MRHNRPPRPTFAALTVVSLSVGIGMTAYYGEAWYQLPTYSAADIEASTELNLRIDLQHRGAHLLPEPARLIEMREQIRNEIEREIRLERKQIQLRFATGLAALVLGAGLLLRHRALRMR